MRGRIGAKKTIILRELKRFRALSNLQPPSHHPRRCLPAGLMKANAKSKARSLITVGIVLGTIAGSAIVAACSAEETKTEEEKKEEGIGLKQIDSVANAPEAAMPVDATPS